MLYLNNNYLKNWALQKSELFFAKKINAIIAQRKLLFISGCANLLDANANKIITIARAGD